MACSALRRRYRDILIGPRDDVRLVYLRGEETLVAERQAARQHHYMPASLVRSQFETLEEPGADERPIVVDVAPSPRDIARIVIERLA